MIDSLHTYIPTHITLFLTIISPFFVAGSNDLSALVVVDARALRSSRSRMVEASGPRITTSCGSGWRSRGCRTSRRFPFTSNNYLPSSDSSSCLILVGKRETHVCNGKRGEERLVTLRTHFCVFFVRAKLTPRAKEGWGGMKNTNGQKKTTPLYFSETAKRRANQSQERTGGKRGGIINVCFAIFCKTRSRVCE